MQAPVVRRRAVFWRAAPGVVIDIITRTVGGRCGHLDLGIKRQEPLLASFRCDRSPGRSQSIILWMHAIISRWPPPAPLCYFASPHRDPRRRNLSHERNHFVPRPFSNRLISVPQRHQRQAVLYLSCCRGPETSRRALLLHPLSPDSGRTVSRDYQTNGTRDSIVELQACRALNNAALAVPGISDRIAGISLKCATPL